MQASEIRIQNTKFKVHFKTTVKITLFLIDGPIKQMLVLLDMIWIEYNKYNSIIMKRSPED